MPTDGRQLVMADRAELITASDPYYRGIGADAFLPHWTTVRPPASTSPRIAGLAGGRGWLIHTLIRRHAEPRIMVTDAFWA